MQPSSVLNIYEVIRWGNDSDDIYTGGANGPDTCFLVRAGSPEAAAALVDPELASMSHEHVKPWAQVIYLIGSDRGSDDKPKVLRGPYIEHAYRHGWLQWTRDGSDGSWMAEGD
jgi:hypothetical protein